jgi:GH18 family chitinase
LDLPHGSQDEIFSQAISSNLSGFVDNIMDVVDTYGYDGVDIDWESNVDWDQMNSLVSALRQDLGTKLLAASIVVTDCAEWAPMEHYMDQINIMTYDMAGTWNPYSWFNSALYGPPEENVWSVNLAVKRCRDAGIPSAKTGIGLPFYGYVSSGGGINGPRQQWGATSPGLNQITFRNLFSSYDLSDPNWDSTGRCPWIQTDEGWISFDNKRSITEKTNYVIDNNLGGWIIWHLASDYLADQEPVHPLMTAVQEVMDSAASNAVAVTSVISPDVSAAVFEQRVIFSIKSREKAFNLMIYNLSGHNVWEHSQRNAQKGCNNVIWDFSSSRMPPPGIYLMVLEDVRGTAVHRTFLIP